MQNVYKDIKKREDAGSCNFCKRGRSEPGNDCQVFPYSHVMVVTGNGGVVVRFCNDCFIELKKL